MHRKFNFDRSYLFVDTEITLRGNSRNNIYYHLIRKEHENTLAVVGAKSLLEDLPVKKLDEIPDEFKNEDKSKDYLFFAIELKPQ